MKKQKELKYYTLDAILEKHAHYNIIIGQRSNGKSTAVLRYALQQYCAGNGQTAYIRRHEDPDLKPRIAGTVCDGIVALGYVEEFTGGKWTTIVYRGQKWFLACPDPEEEGKYIIDEKPFMIGFAVSMQEKYKSTAYPEINTVIFEEFLTKSFYLVDEFILFMNLLSTIIRQRDNVKIFMIGNTVNKWSPYFSEMGLEHVKDMKQGTIDVYSYGDSDLKVAVEFSDFPSKVKPSDVYFAFNNPRLNMITGQGQVWELAIYPHLPEKYAPKDIIFTYFIQFDGELLQCEIISVKDVMFTYIHRKTTELQDPGKDLIFTPDVDARQNWRRKITAPPDKLGRKILWFFNNDKVFYQDNNVGEIVQNYLKYCG